jgi:mono/diheme cytochrome c family protein
MRTPHLPLILVAVVLVIAISACASPTPAAAPTVAGPTAGQLADQGKLVFASHCAKCHGDQGQGVTAPANIGPNAQLEKYKTAKGLYDYVSTVMPNDAPGSLSQQEYMQVVSYLLVQNKFVSPQTPINPNTLDNIPLIK